MDKRSVRLMRKSLYPADMNEKEIEDMSKENALIEMKNFLN